MASMASRRAAIAGPSAKRMPSSRSATITPEDISTERPSASSEDQKSDAGIPRYMQVISPTFGFSKGVIVLRRKLGATRTSLSLMMKYERVEALIIFSSEYTFAFGHSGGPEKIIRLGIFGYRCRTSSAT